MIQIKTYETREGKAPFNEWLYSKKIDAVVRSRILIRLDKLRVGYTGDCKPVGQGVFELRLNFGPGYRVYFAYRGKEIIILMTGGDKSTQKKDITKAIEWWGECKRGAFK